MKVGKWVLLGLGAFVVLSAAGVTGIVLLVFSLTKGVAEGGTNFLALLGEGQTQQAYLSTAKALRAQQDEARFTQAVQGLGLTEYASVSWHHRSIDNGQGRLEGTVTTKQGGAIPVTLTLVKEDGTWKVLSVDGPPGGVNTGAGQASARKTSRWSDDR